MTSISETPPLHIPVTDLFSLFFNDERYPVDKVIFQATDAEHRSYTWSQLQHWARRFATVLAKNQSFQRNRRLGIVAPNDIDVVPVLLGTWLAGGAATAVNPNYTASEIGHQLQDSDASLVITHHSSLANVLLAVEPSELTTAGILLLGDGRDSTSNFEHWQELSSAISESEVDAFVAPSIDSKTTPAFLPYSSGTTGLPKGAVLTHYNLCANVLQMHERLKSYISWQGGPENTIADVAAAASYDVTAKSGGDSVLSVLPVFHVYGNTMELLLPLWIGTTSYISPGFSTADFASNIQRFGITQLLVVPPILLWLAQATDQLNEKLGKGWSHSVRVCISGAAPLATDLIERIRKQLGWDVIQGYGATETSPVLTIQDIATASKALGSVGAPLSEVELKIVELENSGQESLDEHKQGEIIARGPNVFLGYLNREEATRASLGEDGWYRTGDIGYIEQHSGQLYIQDRIKDVIKSHGFQVAPAELEAVLLECSIVADAAVIGVSVPEQQTEVPRAYCVRKGGLANAAEADTELVQQWTQSKLAKFKWLRGGVIWVETIPKSPTGKILRRLLREQERPCRNGLVNSHVERHKVSSVS